MSKENDVVLVYFENKPFVFARIERIEPDVKRDWHHVKLLLLQMPPHPVTWILRTAYIHGDEFTMNGKRIRLEPVACPEDAPTEKEVPEKNSEKPEVKGHSKVISFPGRKKN